MEGILKVTPEKLLQTSEEFGNMAVQMSGLTQEMMSLVDSLKGVWSGEAQAAYGNRFNMLNTDMDRLYKMVVEHSNDLSAMAQSYQEAENANAETGNSMDVNVVS